MLYTWLNWNRNNSYHECLKGFFSYSNDYECGFFIRTSWTFFISETNVKGSEHGYLHYPNEMVSPSARQMAFQIIRELRTAIIERKKIQLLEIEAVYDSDELDEKYRVFESFFFGPG